VARRRPIDENPGRQFMRKVTVAATQMACSGIVGLISMHP